MYESVTLTLIFIDPNLGMCEVQQSLLFAKSKKVSKVWSNLLSSKSKSKAGNNTFYFKSKK